MRYPFVLLISLVTLISGGVAAQEANTVTEQGAWLDLAAMALAPEDVPAGFFDDYGEWLVSPAAFSELVLGGGPVPADLDQVYQSFYFNDTEQVAIHNYLFTYTTP